MTPTEIQVLWLKYVIKTSDGEPKWMEYLWLTENIQAFFSLMNSWGALFEFRGSMKPRSSQMISPLPGSSSSRFNFAIAPSAVVPSRAAMYTFAPFRAGCWSGQIGRAHV